MRALLVPWRRRARWRRTVRGMKPARGRSSVTRRAPSRGRPRTATAASWRRTMAGLPRDQGHAAPDAGKAPACCRTARSPIGIERIAPRHYAASSRPRDLVERQGRFVPRDAVPPERDHDLLPPLRDARRRRAPLRDLPSIAGEPGATRIPTGPCTLTAWTWPGNVGELENELWERWRSPTASSTCGPVPRIDGERGG